MFLAVSDLNGDVDEFLVLAEQLPVSLHGFRVVCHDGDNGGILTRADLPDVKIGDDGISVTLDCAAYLVGQIGSMALGAALAWWLRDNLILALGVGIVVMIVGVAVSMWLLFRTMGRRTDHTKTYQQYRAERANKS